MSCKALIFDIDGTAVTDTVPLAERFPTSNVVNALKRAQEKGIKVSFATGRNFNSTKHLLPIFNLHSPCIVGGGTKIINPQTLKTLWQTFIPKETINRILEFVYDENLEARAIWAGDILQNLIQEKSFIDIDESVIYFDYLDENSFLKLKKFISTLANVSVMEFASMSTPGLHHIHVLPIGFNKKSSVLQLLKMIKVNVNESIGVGDGSNDIDMWDAVGTRVVMGNAKDELKMKYADYIAPSVYNDGLVWVIEKLILQES